MFDYNTGLPDFNGPFADILPEYIRYKRALGFKYCKSTVYRLREMDTFFKEHGIREPVISREMYESFTALDRQGKCINAASRRDAVRGFAQYLYSMGYSNIYTGYDDTRVFKNDFTPYIFSKDEINRMFRRLSDVCRENPSYENDTFRLLMLMYYCCGLRKAEAQNLRVENVDFETGKITILEGKNNVSRIVVAAPSLLNELCGFREKYFDRFLTGGHLFQNKNGGRYSDGCLYKKYRRLLDDSKIPPRADGKRQRLHDLRHSFCVRVLENMQAKGTDIYAFLPLLSAHLGHQGIRETEYYLRLTGEGFENILAKAKACNPDVFPKIGRDAE